MKTSTSDHVTLRLTGTLKDDVKRAALSRGYKNDSEFLREAVRNEIARDSAANEERFAFTVDRVHQKLNQIYSGLGAIFSVMITALELDPDSPELTEAMRFFFAAKKEEDNAIISETAARVAGQTHKGSAGEPTHGDAGNTLPKDHIYFG